ncbi:DUF421 domain-containing protein [Salipaludibacillus sp. CUR1]|uniref:YetF domain-containing protein n=1 Tax=Salipaludibacillus sp. CUR1 TaxID=2820003 RepID=UPI001E533D65|nr:DUF421 domain-containing protein [Salipaludibacillus sp. CUR1]MCE7790878.1 DUF421 domain-containing protein [Salipaludibacillus sp. CUR1]
MEPNFLDLTLKLITGFFMLFLITRILGKTTIKQLTPFDFVSAIVLSELLGNGVYESNIPLSYIAYAIILWGVLLVVMEKGLLKSKKIRGTMEGNPSIVIRDGIIDRRELKKNRMNVNQLLSLLRQSEIFSIREVAYAILESNGGLSIMKKSKYKKVSIDDLQLPEKPVYLPASLILDGEILEDNLRDLGFTRPWLTNQLTSLGYYDIKEIMYADWLTGEGLYVIPKQKFEAK